MVKIGKKELKFLISEGEGYNLEFKETFSDSLARDVCAFANANGGKILLGVSDDRKIREIRITNKLKSQIYDMTRNFDPKFEISLEEANSIIIIKVPEGPNKPYSVNGKFYLRYGPNSQQLTREEIREFFQKEGLILFDEKPNYDFNLDKDFNDTAYKNFIMLVKIGPVLKRKEILDNLSLLKDSFIKNAGVLLFCKEITKFFINATITCVLYQGRDKYKILDRKEFDTDLYSNFQNTVLYLQSKLNTEFIIKGGPREERLELPEEALREALLNAIAHRSYFVSGANILVEIFSDRVEITNPGGLVKGMSKKDLGKKSLSRNNLLFGLMQRMNLVEKVGSGIRRMKKAMEDYNLRGPKFKINKNWFVIIFGRKKRIPERLVEGLVEGLVESQKKILMLISKNPRISKKELAISIGISTTAIDKNISQLKKKGFLKRVGPAKGGYWKILEK